MSDEQATWRAEVEALLRAYIGAFESDGTRDDLQAFCALPLAYVGDDGVQMRERYPFDPVKLRAHTGLARSRVDLNVVHVDGHKAHVLIEGTRERADGSVIEEIASVYVLHRLDGEWKITMMSGVRTPR